MCCSGSPYDFFIRINVGVVDTCRGSLVLAIQEGYVAIQGCNVAIQGGYVAISWQIILCLFQQYQRQSWMNYIKGGGSTYAAQRTFQPSQEGQ